MTRRSQVVENVYPDLWFLLGRGIESLGRGARGKEKKEIVWNGDHF